MASIIGAHDEPGLRAAVRANVAAALAEDVGSGDITAALVPASATARATVITREAGILCGAAWAEEACRQVDPMIVLTWGAADGDALTAGQRIVTLEGRARGLLTAERTMLNFLQTLSGTATATHRLVALVAGTGCRLLDTRKTIPGLRVAQKYAVRCGGGHNHRMGLFDAFLIKENHIATAGSIATAVANARALGPGKPVEVEVETLEQLREAIACAVDIAMLDNFTAEATREAVAAVRTSGSTIKLEASGGLDETSITAIAAAGVDYISVGSLTKRLLPLDLSMRLTLQLPSSP